MYLLCDKLCIKNRKCKNEQGRTTESSGSERMIDEGDIIMLCSVSYNRFSCEYCKMSSHSDILLVVKENFTKVVN